MVERLIRERNDRRMGGGLKDRPQCERCGRPVRVSSDDYLQEEILCTHCATESNTGDSPEYDEQ